jgi:hypothetical protein
MATKTKNVKGLLGKKLGMTQAWDENNKMSQSPYRAPA